jgi:uncharacterized phage protein (TIGR02218 family)
MTFDAVEKSVQGGRPVEIYTFARDFQRWRYTSADRTVTVSGQPYLPRAIARSDIEANAEKARSALRVTVPRDLEVADLYRVTPPTLPVTLVIQKYHFGDGELASIWAGRILGVKFSGIAAEITLEPTFTSIRRTGLRRIYQRQCPHVLYGNECGVNREAYRTDGTVDSIAGLVLTIPAASALATGWFAGGYVEFLVDGGIAERSFITDHSGAAVTLSSTPYGLTSGATVKLYPGCNHTIATCNSKFNNALNYGGMPYFTQKNPFGGDPVY